MLAREPNAGRVILLVTDGRDVSSHATLERAEAAARAARATVYAVGIKGQQFSAKALTAIAARTGGVYRAAASSRALATIYGAIARELRRTWQLDYLTAGRPGDRLQLVVGGDGAAGAQLTLPGEPPGGSRGLRLPAFAYGAGGAARPDRRRARAARRAARRRLAAGGAGCIAVSPPISARRNRARRHAVRDCGARLAPLPLPRHRARLRPHPPVADGPADARARRPAASNRGALLHLARNRLRPRPSARRRGGVAGRDPRSASPAASRCRRRSSGTGLRGGRPPSKRSSPTC